MIKVNNEKTRTTVLTCGVFERTSHLFLKFLLLALNKKISAGHVGFIWRLKDFENKYLYLSFNPLTLCQFADELFECVWPFCEIGASRVKSQRNFISQVKPNWNTCTHFNISLAFLFSSNIVDCLTAKDHLFL